MKILIAGAGIMGTSMACAFAKASHDVTIYNHRDVTLEKAKKTIEETQRELASLGQIRPEQAASICSSIKYTSSEECFKAFDVMIESIVENLEIKGTFYAKISRLAPEDAIIATNTSALPITELSKFVKHPERFLGMHWFNPPSIIPLIEIIKGEKTSSFAVEKIRLLSEQIGKKPILVQKDVKGFVANRLQLALLREALYIAEEGISSYEDIDKAMKYALGLRYAFLGPFEVTDLGGLDTFNSISKTLLPDLCDTKLPQRLLYENVEKGRLGIKTNAGFYDYTKECAALKIAERDEILMKLCRLLEL